MPMQTAFDSLDEIPEALRSFYVEKDRKFVLDADLDNHPRFAALATALERQKADRKKAADELAKLKGKVPDDFDPEEWRHLKDLAARLEDETKGEPEDDDDDKGAGKDNDGKEKRRAGGTGNGGDAANAAQSYADKIAARLEHKHKRELAAEQKTRQAAEVERDRYRALLHERTRDAELNAALDAAKIAPGHRRAVFKLHRDSVRVVEDEDGVRVVYRDAELGEDRDVTKALGEWAQTDEGQLYVLAPLNDGGGAQAGRRRGSAGVNPWRKETWNLTEQGRLVKNDAALANRYKAEAGIR